MVFILSFAAVALAISVGISSYVGYQAWMERRNKSSFRAVGSGTTNQGLGPTSLLRDQRSRVPLAKLLPLSRESEARMARDLERAGWPIHVVEYLSIRVGSAVAGASAGLLLVILLQSIQNHQ